MTPESAGSASKEALEHAPGQGFRSYERHETKQEAPEYPKRSLAAAIEFAPAKSVGTRARFGRLAAHAAGPCMLDAAAPHDAK